MAQNRFYSSTAQKTSLNGGISNSATSVVVLATTGFPVSFPYTLIIDRDTVNEEVVKVTGAAGTTLTVVRGQDGTSGVSHGTGIPVEHGVSAQDFNEPQAHIAASSAVHGLAGSVVGTTDSQTLTNKTVNLTSNTLTGTKAQFNTACSDADFATLAGVEALTNKTVSLGSNTVSGTTAQFNTALSDNDFATLAGSETLTNKTMSGASNTFSSIPESAVTNLVSDLAAKPKGYVGSVALSATSTNNITLNTYSLLSGTTSTDNGADTPATNLSYSFTATAGKRYRITFSGAAVTSVAGTIAGTQIQVSTNPGGTLRGDVQGNVTCNNTANNWGFCTVAVFHCTTGGTCVVGGYMKNSNTSGSLNAVTATELLVEES